MAKTPNSSTSASESAPASKETDKSTVVEEKFLLYFVPCTDDISDKDPLTLTKALEKIEKGKYKLNLLLHTLGGDPYVSAKVINILQNTFKSVTVVIPYWAMSGGTLIALGCNEIVVPRNGQLGPLDMQMPHPITEKQISALDYSRPMTHILGLVNATATRFYKNIRDVSGKRVTTSEAVRVAYENAVKLYEPIVSQLDPIELSHSSRLLQVAEIYGKEFLVKYSLKPDFKFDAYAEALIKYFVNNYPSHDFGIFYTQLENFGLNVIEPEQYQHWEKVWKFMLEYIEDDCSPDPKKTKSIQLVDLK